MPACKGKMRQLARIRPGHRLGKAVRRCRFRGQRGWGRLLRAYRGRIPVGVPVPVRGGHRKARQRCGAHKEQRSMFLLRCEGNLLNRFGPLGSTDNGYAGP